MSTTADEQAATIAELSNYEYGWRDTDSAGQSARRGLNEDVVRDISAKKGEPEWMLDLRLKGLRLFDKKPMPAWGSDLTGIDFDNIKYFVRSTEQQATSWEELPEDIKNTYDKLGIPEAEKQRLVAGVAAQYESEVVYHKIREDLEEQGVVFLDTDTGLREYEDMYREYFGSVIPVGDNKFAALNTAVWSGGSFIYVPKGVHVEIPLQAYFRINTENMGQFERTLIIVDEDAYVHYVEGCTAPIYSSDSLHSAVVEIVVKKGARCRYTTIQNWSTNVYNLVTKRAIAHEGATMEWVDGNLGSKVTMKYPAVWLTGPHARGETLSIAFAGEKQHQDAGAKMVHAAPHTSSSIISKSVARGGGRTSYRGLVQVHEGAHHSKSTVKCDALLVDDISRSDTYPYVDVREDDVAMGHEATVSKVSEDQLFYLMSRGLDEDEAMAMIVRGFVEPIARELPMEYALELKPTDRVADGRGCRVSTVEAPPSDLAPRVLSNDPADHETPHGREEEWRFTPVAKLGDFFDAGQRGSVTATPSEFVTMIPAEMESSTVEEAAHWVASDLPSALARTHATSVVSVSIPAAREVNDIVVVDLAGSEKFNYGRIEISVGAFSKSHGRSQARHDHRRKWNCGYRRCRPGRSHRPGPLRRSTH